MRAARVNISKSALHSILQLPDDVEIIEILSTGRSDVWSLLLTGDGLPDVQGAGLFPEIQLRIIEETSPDCRKITTRLEAML